MNKKRKFATTLLATALLSYGFTLDSTVEVTTVEPEDTAEVGVEKTSTSPCEVQHLVAEEEIQVEIYAEEPIVEEVESLPTVLTETEPLPPETPPQATTLTQTQGNTAEPVATVTQAETTQATREPAINIPEPDTMNGFDYGTSQTIQPDVTKPNYTEEQLTDPTHAPDGTPVEVIVPEVCYPEEPTSTKMVPIERTVV